MIISIASGKGGTGKTTVAVNLALSLGHGVQLLDCDVGAPNCHIFIRPDLTAVESIAALVPAVDNSKCNGCGLCAEICRFNALALAGRLVMSFPELCHGCGGCFLVCPTGALSEGRRELGLIKRGEADGIELTWGILNIGVPNPPPLIREVKRRAKGESLTIIDAPPGTSCAMVEAVRGSDFCLLVTEPTPFGLWDLRLAVEVLRVLGIPFGVLVNRSDIGDSGVFGYCAEQEVPVLTEIPQDREIAEAYSRGEVIIKTLPRYREIFERLYPEIERLAKDERAHSYQR